MPTKITITLKQNEDDGNPLAMAETLTLLGTLAQAPTQKIVLALECEEEDAESWRDELRVALAGRPVGVDVELKTESKETVERGRLQRVTPMDRAWAN